MVSELYGRSPKFEKVFFHRKVARAAREEHLQVENPEFFMITRLDIFATERQTRLPDADRPAGRASETCSAYIELPTGNEPSARSQVSSKLDQRS
jgi:hypothetical protein